MVVPAKKVIPLPAVDPSFIPLMVSGLTASIALEQVGHLGSGETVMVTGATGSSAVNTGAWSLARVVADGIRLHFLFFFLFCLACVRESLRSAAAGSTGQYAVQLAKAAGNHVIGTCSSDAKVTALLLRPRFRSF